MHLAEAVYQLPSSLPQHDTVNGTSVYIVQSGNGEEMCSLVNSWTLFCFVSQSSSAFYSNLATDIGHYTQHQFDIEHVYLRQNRFFHLSRK